MLSTFSGVMRVDTFRKSEVDKFFSELTFRDLEHYRVIENKVKSSDDCVHFIRIKTGST